MHSLEYAPDWADLVIGQLTASHRASSPELWGYACFCIGSKFDAFIAENYYAVDHEVGDYLHVFTMLPPPQTLLDERIKRLRGMKDEACEVARQRLEGLRHKWYSAGRGQEAFRQETLQRERAVLLSELRDAGIDAGMDTDFLFFDFRRPGEAGAMDIDIIAAEQSPLRDDAKKEEYFRLFRTMAKTAEESYEKRDTVEQFANNLKWRWCARLAASQTRHLREFIHSVLAPIASAK